MARNKLEMLRPTAGESVDAYIARGSTRDLEPAVEFCPQEGDSLGEYLLRLRLANDLSPESVEENLASFPNEAAVTRSELAQLESGYPEFVNEIRLRTLASLYGVPHEWVLQVAQYHVEHYTPPIPATDNSFALLSTRAIQFNSLDPGARQTLQEIFNEIIGAVQTPDSEVQDNS